MFLFMYYITRALAVVEVGRREGLGVVGGEVGSSCGGGKWEAVRKEEGTRTEASDVFPRGKSYCCFCIADSLTGMLSPAASQKSF